MSSWLSALCCVRHNGQTFRVSSFLAVWLGNIGGDRWLKKCAGAGFIVIKHPVCDWSERWLSTLIVAGCLGRFASDFFQVRLLQLFLPLSGLCQAFCTLWAVRSPASFWSFYLSLLVGLWAQLSGIWWSGAGGEVGWAVRWCCYFWARWLHRRCDYWCLWMLKRFSL